MKKIIYLSLLVPLLAFAQTGPVYFPQAPIPPGADAGAAQVVPAGSSVGRSLADHLGAMVNVLNEGAIADWNGSTGTDNRAFFATAQAKAAAFPGGGIVFIPRGRYRIAPNPDTTRAAIGMVNNVTFVGEGEGTVLYFDSPAAGGAFASHLIFGWRGVYTDFPTLDPIADQHPTTRIGFVPTVLGATTLSETPSGAFAAIQPGEWICITEGAAPKWNTKMQWVKVVSNAAGVLTLDQPLALPFNNDSGTGVGLYRTIPVENAWVRNLTMTGSLYWYGFGTGESVSGGVEKCKLDPPSGSFFSVYANGSQDFTFSDNEVTHGLFGGFNRGARGNCIRNRFRNVGSQTMEFGEGGSFNKTNDNQFSGINLVGNFIGGGNSWGDEYVGNTFAGKWGTLFNRNGGYGTVRFNRNYVSGAIDYSVSIGTAGYPNSYGAVETWNTEIDGNTFVSPPGQTGVIIAAHEYPQTRNTRITNNRFIGDYATGAVSNAGIKIGGGNAGDTDHRTIVIFGNRASAETDPAPPSYTDVGDGVQTWIPMGPGAATGRVWSFSTPNAGGGSTSWDAGSIMLAVDPSYGRAAFVTAGGTFGTLNGGATTGSITTGTAILTVNNLTQLAVGRYITIAGVSGVKRITALNRAALQVTLNSNANATVTGAAVAFSSPSMVRLYTAPTLSGDRGDFSVTLTAGVDPPTVPFATTLTANRTVTLSITGAMPGDTFRIVRTGLGAFTIDVGPGLKTMPSATAAFVDVAFNGAVWVLTGYGTL